MKIAIDAREINRGGGGKSRYIRELARALGKIDRENKYFLYVHEIPDIRLPKNFHLIIVPKIRWINFLWIVKDLKLRKPDVFLSATRYYPVIASSVKTILVVFDLGVYVKKSRPTLNTVLVEKLTAPRAIKKADKIITVSNSTARDIIDRFKISRKKISTVFLAPFEKPEEEAKWKDVKQKHKLPSEYMLFLGMLGPRKNVDGLICAYKILPSAIRKKIPLVLVGKMGWKKNEIMKAIGKTKNIILAGYAEDEELPAIYSHASVFIYPSWHEGFGLPVIEAFSYGVPVVTSNNSSLAEIAKGRALLVNPDNQSAIADAITELILDKTLRRKFINQGLNYAKTLSWEKTARKTLEIIEEVTAKS